MAWCLSKEEVYRSNVRTSDDFEQQIQDTLATVCRDFLRKRVESVSAMLQKCDRCGGTCVQT
jgi:uncharacterized Fe-S radical SAM superfamily protein PflX